MIALLLIALGVVLRLVPHLPNFTPIAAIALFGGTYLPKKQAFVMPLAALVISDSLIGFDSLHGRFIVYASFLIVSLIGRYVRRHKTLGDVVMSSLAGSIVFYLITNFALFYSATMYAHNAAGVIASYRNALPFFRNTLLGDMCYTAVLFGAYEIVRLIVSQNAPKSYIIVDRRLTL